MSSLPPPPTPRESPPPPRGGGPDLASPPSPTQAANRSSSRRLGLLGATALLWFFTPVGIWWVQRRSGWKPSTKRRVTIVACCFLPLWAVAVIVGFTEDPERVAAPPKRSVTTSTFVTENEDALVTPRQAPPELAVPCSEYDEAFEAWLRTPSSDAQDDEFAEELDVMAGDSAAGTTLEAPLRDMAKKFRAHQLNIDGATIVDLCSGKVPVGATADEGQTREAFLRQVRRDAPELRAIADDDLVAGADVTCASLQMNPTLNATSSVQRYLLLINIASASVGREDGPEVEPFIEATGAFFCPDLSSTITSILAAG